MAVPSLHASVRLSYERPSQEFTLKVDFETQGHVTGIFGASGSGKTTLLEVVAGLRRGAQGTVRLGDSVWQDTDKRVFVPPYQRAIGYVPQEGLLFPHLNVRQNLLSGSARAERGGKRVGELLRSVCELLELESLLNRSARTLSGGERQRVAVGRALCSGPRLLVLDEPLAALDIPLKRRILPFLGRVRAQFDIPMLIVSHEPMTIQALCDDVLALRDGAVVSRGLPSAVLSSSEVCAANDDGLELENIVPCVVESLSGHGSVVRFGCEESARVVAQRCELAPGSSALMVIAARDIIIATERPFGVSARNIIKGRIDRISPRNRSSWVHAAIAPGLAPIVVELSDFSCWELGLRAGQSVFLVVKAMGIRLYRQ